MKFLAVLFLAFTLSGGLTGCAVVETQPIVEEAETRQEKIQAAFAETRALLIAFNQTIAQNARDRVWTKEQAQGYLDESRALRLKLDKAEAFLGDGDLDTAEAQRTIIRQAIVALQRRAAATGRGE